MVKWISRILNKIRWVTLGINAQERGSKYENLDFLISRAKARMRINPKCPYCGHDMMFRRSAIVTYKRRSNLEMS